MVTLFHCGALVGEGSVRSPAIKSALFFSNCAQVSISNTSIIQSDGLGLVTVDSTDISVSKASFLANTNHLKCIHGGGASFRFESVHTFNKLEVIDTIFWHNSLDTASDSSTTSCSEHGGGIYLELSGSNALVEISFTEFLGNSAQIGAGMSVRFLGNAANNTVEIISSIFSLEQNDHGSLNQDASRGGGMHIFCGSSSTAGHNAVVLRDTHFLLNSAAAGGGLSILTNRNTLASCQINITGGRFIQNTASVGAAVLMEVYETSSAGSPATVYIDNIQVKSNYVLRKKVTFGIGIVYTEGVPLQIGPSVLFEDNIGTALMVSATAVHFLEKSTAEFTNNTGHSGGAVALINTAYMTLGNHTQLNFTGNQATDKGGAIFVASYGLANINTYFNPKCFVLPINQSNMNISLHFSKNMANKQNNSIFAMSSSQCQAGIQETFFCDERNWHYDSSCYKHVSMAGNRFNYSESLALYPGREISLPHNFLDDFGNNLTNSTALLVNLSENGSILEVSSISSPHTSDSSLSLHQSPDRKKSHTSLAIEARSPRVPYAELEMEIIACQPGYTATAPDVSGHTGCQCLDKSYHSSLKCNQTDPSDPSASLYDEFCMTLWKNITVVTLCPFQMFVNPQRKTHYVQLPDNVTQLEEHTCGKMGFRKGPFCAECQDGMAAAVYSFVFSCRNCTSQDIWYNLPKYLVLQLLPPTILFIVVVLFSLNLTSGPINTYVFYCQVLTLPENILEFMDHFYINSGMHSAFYLALYVPFILWNLEFFLVLVPPFCLHPSITTMHIVCLDYLTAAYPLFLIATSYALIELHARGFRVAVCLWGPFRKCFGRFRRSWNIQRSIVDSFAAFLVLSYMKFANATFNLMVPNYVYNSTGNVVHSLLLADSSVEYSSPEHWPFLLLALFVLVVLVLPPPLFLLLYPFAFFRKILTKLKLNSLSVYTFVEAFQGCFKDGTNGRHDCRFYAAAGFFYRIAVVITRIAAFDLSLQRMIQLCVTWCMVCLVVVFLPYKRMFYNQLEVLILMILLVIQSISLFYAIPESVINDSSTFEIIFSFFITLPVISTTGYMIFRVGKNILKFWKRTGYNLTEETPFLSQVWCEQGSDSIPHRLEFPQVYEQEHS